MMEATRGPESQSSKAEGDLAALREEVARPRQLVPFLRPQLPSQPEQRIINSDPSARGPR